MSDEFKGDFSLLVARGLTAPVVYPFRKFGTNPAVGATEELVSQTGAASPYRPTSAQSVEIVSADAADAAAGAGARTVTVMGLNTLWLEVSETVTLNGTTPVALTTAFRRIYRAFVVTAGTYGAANTGVVTVRVAGAGTTFVTMAAGRGQTETSHYTVPADRTLYIHDVHLFSESTKPTSFFMWQVPHADTATAAKRIVIEFSGVDGAENLDYPDAMLEFGPQTDVWFGATAGTSANVSAEYCGYLVVDPDVREHISG